MAAVDGKVYVVGGFDASGQAVATVEVYDPATDSWTQRASLPSPLHHVNVAAVGSKLYVVGGLSGSSFTARGTTLEYDPGLDRWSSLTSMPGGTERGASGVAVLDGRIVVAGGLRGDSVTDASVFDPETNAWSPLQPLGVARDHLGRRHRRRAGVRRHRAGGRRAEGRARGPRREQRELEPARGHPDGARRGAPPRSSRAVSSSWAERVTPPTRPASSTRPRATTRPPTRWRSETSMRTGRHGIGAAAVGNRVYVPGGATHEGFGAVAVNESFGY